MAVKFWLWKIVRRRKKRRVVKRTGRRDYLKHREEARALAMERLEHFNKFYQFKIGRISIRNQKTRWGSCSKRGNLNFNYRIALLSKEAADYIIVHELCHLGEFNHSAKFWRLVACAVPDYLEIRKSLRRRTLL